MGLLVSRVARTPPTLVSAMASTPGGHDSAGGAGGCGGCSAHTCETHAGACGARAERTHAGDERGDERGVYVDDCHARIAACEGAARAGKGGCGCGGDESGM